MLLRSTYGRCRYVTMHGVAVSYEFICSIEHRAGRSRHGPPPIRHSPRRSSYSPPPSSQSPPRSSLCEKAVPAPALRLPRPTFLCLVRLSRQHDVDSCCEVGDQRVRGSFSPFEIPLTRNMPSLPEDTRFEGEPQPTGGDFPASPGFDEDECACTGL